MSSPGKITLLLLPAASLWWRDIIRFLRQRNRIVGALATPLVFWILLGSGFTGSFRPPGEEADVSYLIYFFPGTVVLIMLFTAIFSTISVIEDRKEGFLQGVLVSPASSCSIVLGKFLGGTTLATLQGFLFCILAPFAGISLSPCNLLMILISFPIVGFAMTGLGFLIAWPLDSTQGFHALMNIILMPLWMMSGALFPPAPGGWTWWVSVFNPVTYCVGAIRCALHTSPGTPIPGVCAFGPSLGISLAFGLALFLVGGWMVVKKKGPLP